MTNPVALTDDERNNAVTHLMKQGLANGSTSATRVVDALAKHGFTAFEPPTPGHGSAVEDVLHELDVDDRELLCNVIVAKTNGLPGAAQPWPGWLQTVALAVETGIENSADIEQARAELRETLATAEQAVRDASRVLARLAGALYDVDYAEGSNLIAKYISEAHDSIRTAALVNPHRNA